MKAVCAKYVISFLIVLGLSISSIGWAAEDSPIPMLDRVVNGVLKEIKQRRFELTQNRNALYELVEQKILPYVDFDEVAKWVAGRNAWQAATPKVQTDFVAAFKKVLLRTYAQTLINEQYERVEFLPFRGAIGDKKRLQVASLLTDSNGRVLHVDYRVIHHPENWRVYDIVIEGVSLLKGYQAQFTDLIRQKGLPAVIEELRQQAARKTGS